MFLGSVLSKLRLGPENRSTPLKLVPFCTHMHLTVIHEFWLTVETILHMFHTYTIQSPCQPRLQSSDL